MNIDLEKYRTLINNNEFDAYSEEQWANAAPAVDKHTDSEMWNNIRQTITPDVHNRHTTRVLWLYRIAAAILLPVCIGLSVYLYHHRELLTGGRDSVCEVVVEHGQKSTLTLPDGTKVWLNSGTKFTYGSDYNIHNRQVKLEGEAYFEVAHNPSKPFVVNCSDLQVAALGTVFDVKAYPTDDIVSTALLDGCVEVYNRDNTVRLAPNQRLNYNKLSGDFSKVRIADSREVDFWRRNLLYFHAASLGEITKTLERMYGITVEFQSEELKNVFFSGTIRNNSLSNVFHVISLSYPLSYTIDKDLVTIRSTINSPIK
jgi:ferric-dicitrate binding protein FerR (iron transport regulator)